MKKYFVLFYDYVNDAVNKRAPLRPAHLALANEWASRGELCFGGAWSDVSGAMILFHVPSQERVVEFAQADPYVKVRFS
jgi:uncharacterized protein YciI